MKILVIDDEALVRRALRRSAERRGHFVIEGANGEHGLELWRSEQPDVVFLDVLMPGLTGLQVLEEIGNQHESKVILISAYSGEFNVDKVQSIGADIYLAKPFDDIFEVIKRAEELIGG